MPTAKSKFGFETSSELRSLFEEHYNAWRKRTGEDLSALAQLLGVTPAYLGHVRRYGRIPSRPVLILLALNFKISGEELFRASGIKEPFPYESGLQIARAAEQQGGLFSVRLDMDGFAESVRSIVRSEMRQRNVRDVFGHRPLRIGLNYHQYWLFGGESPPRDGKHTGMIPEFCEMLGVALQKEVQLIYTPFADYLDLLSKGQLDLYGPTMVVPNLPVHVNFTIPLWRLGVAGVFRRKPLNELAELPEPQSIDELRDDRYQIVVLKHSLPHLLANTLLKRPDDSLILCSSDDEGFERVMMRGIKRPAHVFLSNAITAYNNAKKNPRDLVMIFGSRAQLLDHGDNAFAVRPDWPEVVPVVNDAIRFLQARGGLRERIEKAHPGDLREFVEFTTE